MVVVQQFQGGDHAVRRQPGKPFPVREDRLGPVAVFAALRAHVGIGPLGADAVEVLVDGRGHVDDVQRKAQHVGHHAVVAPAPDQPRSQCRGSRKGCQHCDEGRQAIPPKPHIEHR
jgi:hypothetical protein